MKTILFLVGAFLFGSFGFGAMAASHSGASHSGGSVHVGGYTKANGTYVAPHYRSAPDHTTANNWSTKGNVNPYTGQAGTKNPTPSSGSASYSGNTGTPSGVGYGTRSPVSENGGTYESGTQPAEPRPTFGTEPTTFITPGTAKVVNHKEDSILEFQKKSAASGFSEAQFALGMRYMAGDGVPKDEAKGKELIKQASNGSSLRARVKVREMEDAERVARQAALTKVANENPNVKR
jgi:TPR repeat protein